MGDSISERFPDLIPGIAYCAIIASFSFITWRLYKPVSSLMWAFIFSIAFANAMKLPERITLGARFCSSRLLKATIAILGLVTNALIWFQVGIGVVNALIVIVVSFFLSVWIGRRFDLSDRLALLIGVGTSICGPSAIAAAAPAIDAKAEEIGLALSGINLFALLPMFLYPLLSHNTAGGRL
ncbi:putative sulfate exporter family transporter, partial [Candidatus Bathyarchaeota archaeon]|nr:putative sulfate exporter family transporter [Candidatus Bathyarchaeota archaeon]